MRHYYGGAAGGRQDQTAGRLARRILPRTVASLEEAGMEGTQVAAEHHRVEGPRRDRAEGVPLPPNVSVVIPALNEAENLSHVLPRIPHWVSEILVVDGHSTDGTPDVAMRLRSEVRIVQQTGRGKGAALRTGFEHATGDIIVMLDADGSMDPAEISSMVNA